jgi:hypothetical protein
MGLRRRDHYFTEAVTSYTCVGVAQLAVQHQRRPEEEPLTDERTACVNDPLRQVTRFAADLRHAWQELDPGIVLVADETMVGWTGATNIHITMLPNKPTSRGVRKKTMCSAWTRVMGFDFVEVKAEQQQSCTDEGLTAAVMMRLTEPWHKKPPMYSLQMLGLTGSPRRLRSCAAAS